MLWIVGGKHRASGIQTRMPVEAETEEEARAQAELRGVIAGTARLPEAGEAGTPLYQMIDAGPSPVPAAATRPDRPATVPSFELVEFVAVALLLIGFLVMLAGAVLMVIGLATEPMSFFSGVSVAIGGLPLILAGAVAKMLRAHVRHHWNDRYAAPPSS